MLENYIILPILFILFSIHEISTKSQQTSVQLPKNWVKRTQNKVQQNDGLDRLEFLTTTPIGLERLRTRQYYTYK
jgi:hypothetical protein